MYRMDWNLAWKGFLTCICFFALTLKAIAGAEDLVSVRETITNNLQQIESATFQVEVSVGERVFIHERAFTREGKEYWFTYPPFNQSSPPANLSGGVYAGYDLSSFRLLTRPSASETYFGKIMRIESVQKRLRDKAADGGGAIVEQALGWNIWGRPLNAWVGSHGVKLLGDIDTEIGKCKVLEVPYGLGEHVRFYLSVDRGFAIHKRQSFSEDGRLETTLAVNDWEELIDGVWFPFSGDLIPPAESVSPIDGVPIETAHFVVTSAALNSQLPNSLFSIEFREGDLITDDYGNPGKQFRW